MADSTSPSSSSPAQDLTEQIIWGALLVSHFIYGGVIYAIHPAAQPATEIVVPLSGIAVCMAVAALVVDMVFLGDAQIDKWITAAKAEGVTGKELGAKVVLRAQTFQLVRWMLAESVTILGLMLALMGQIPFQRFLMFVAGGIAVHVYCRPKLAQIRETAERRAS